MMTLRDRVHNAFPEAYAAKGMQDWTDAEIQEWVTVSVAAAISALNDLAVAMQRTGERVMAMIAEAFEPFAARYLGRASMTPVHATARRQAKRTALKIARRPGSIGRLV